MGFNFGKAVSGVAQDAVSVGVNYGFTRMAARRPGMRIGYRSKETGEVSAVGDVRGIPAALALTGAQGMNDGIIKEAIKQVARGALHSFAATEAIRAEAKAAQQKANGAPTTDRAPVADSD